VDELGEEGVFVGIRTRRQQRWRNRWEGRRGCR
jgi:hypothetical protein